MKDAVEAWHKNNVTTTVDGLRETQDVLGSLALAAGVPHLSVGFNIPFQIARAVRDAVRQRRQDADDIKIYHREAKLAEEQLSRFDRRLASVDELRQNLGNGEAFKDDEFCRKFIDFNSKYLREAHSLGEGAKPPVWDHREKKEETIAKLRKFFQSDRDADAYLKYAEELYGNTRKKFEASSKGVREAKGGEERKEQGYLWYMKNLTINTARAMVDNFKIWKNQSSLTEERGAVRKLVSFGQGFGDVFRGLRLFQDVGEISEEIISGKFLEGGIMEYLKEGGEKLASRFYEDDLVHTLIDHHLQRDDLSEERKEILASLEEKLSHGGKMTGAEQTMLQKIEEQAREMRHRELSGEHLSELEHGAIAEAKHAASEEYGVKSTLEKIALNLTKHNVARNISTITELPARLKRIMNIAERGSEGVIAHLDTMGAGIAKRAYGEDLTALMFQKSSASGTRAIPEDTRERLFQYFTGSIKRDELTKEDEEELQKVEHEAAELGSKHRSGGELADDEAALIAAAENKALIDYLDEGVLEKIANSAGRIREALQGIPDPAVREEAETQLTLIETDPQKYAEGLRLCGAGMLGGGGFASAYEEARAKRKGLHDERGFSKMHALIGISGLAILGTLAMLAYHKGDDMLDFSWPEHKRDGEVDDIVKSVEGIDPDKWKEENELAILQNVRKSINKQLDKGEQHKDDLLRLEQLVKKFQGITKETSLNEELGRIAMLQRRAENKPLFSDEDIKRYEEILKTGAREKFWEGYPEHTGYLKGMLGELQRAPGEHKREIDTITKLLLEFDLVGDVEYAGIAGHDDGDSLFKFIAQWKEGDATADAYFKIMFERMDSKPFAKKVSFCRDFLSYFDKLQTQATVAVDGNSKPFIEVYASQFQKNRDALTDAAEKYIWNMPILHGRSLGMVAVDIIGWMPRVDADGNETATQAAMVDLLNREIAPALQFNADFIQKMVPQLFGLIKEGHVAIDPASEHYAPPIAQAGIAHLESWRARLPQAADRKAPDTYLLSALQKRAQAIFSSQIQTARGEKGIKNLAQLQQEINKAQSNELLSEEQKGALAKMAENRKTEIQAELGRERVLKEQAAKVEEPKEGETEKVTEKKKEAGKVAPKEPPKPPVEEKGPVTPLPPPTEAQKAAQLLDRLYQSNNSLPQEFKTGIDTVSEAQELMSALDEFSAASKSLFNPEQAVELLDQVTPKTTEALHGLAARVRELSSFESMVEGIRQSAIAPAGSLQAPVSEKQVNDLKRRFEILARGYDAIHAKDMFVRGERLSQLQNQRYTEPLMREYAERVYQKQVKAQEQIIEQQGEISELVKNARVTPARESVTPPAPPAPEGAPTLLVGTELRAAQPSEAVRVFLENLETAIQTGTAEDIKDVLKNNVKESEMWVAVQVTLKKGYSDAALKKIADVCVLLKNEMNSADFDTLKQFIFDRATLMIGAQDWFDNIWEIKKVAEGKSVLTFLGPPFLEHPLWKDDVKLLLNNRIQYISQSAFTSIADARSAGVLKQAENVEDSILNWPILEKGKEIEGARTLGELCQQYVATKSDAIKAEIDKALQEETKEDMDLIRQAIEGNDTLRGKIRITDEGTIETILPSAEKKRIHSDADIYNRYLKEELEAAYEETRKGGGEDMSSFWISPVSDSVTLLDRLSTLSDDKAQEIFQGNAMKMLCPSVDKAHFYFLRKDETEKKTISEMRLKDLWEDDLYNSKVMQEWEMARMDAAVGASAFFYKDVSNDIGNIAGVRTYREARLFSAWCMEALRDWEQVHRARSEQRWPKTDFLQGRAVKDLTVLDYFHFQAENFYYACKGGGVAKEFWSPAHIVKAEGPLVMVKMSEDEKSILFTITGGYPPKPATWGEFERVGLQIPKDIAEIPGFSRSSTAEIPLNRVQFKDGTVEIVEEAQKEREDAPPILDESKEGAKIEQEQSVSTAFLEVQARHIFQTALKLQNEKKWNQAIGLYEDSLKINPNNANVYNNKGICHANLNQFAEAQQSYEKAIELNPRSKETHNNFGWLLLEQKKVDEAIGKFQKGLEVAPNEPHIWTNLAWAYYVKGEFRQAIATNLEILKAHPNELYARYNLGIAYLCNGQLDDAKLEYTQALAGGKDAPAYKSAADDLNDLIKKGVHKSEAEGILRLLQESEAEKQNGQEGTTPNGEQGGAWAETLKRAGIEWGGVDLTIGGQKYESIETLIGAVDLKEMASWCRSNANHLWVERSGETSYVWIVAHEQDSAIQTAVDKAEHQAKVQVAKYFEIIQGKTDGKASVRIFPELKTKLVDREAKDAPYDGYIIMRVAVPKDIEHRLPWEVEDAEPLVNPGEPIDPPY